MRSLHLAFSVMGNSGVAHASAQRDLILLVADGNMKAATTGLLSRPLALSIREVDAQVVVHPERDPGCFVRAPEFLRPLRSRFAHAVVMLDCEGSGRESLGRAEMERDLTARLSPDWGEHAAALVLDPELEVWLWSGSPHVDHALGWAGRTPDLRTWMVKDGLLGANEVKPDRPKEAVEKALRVARKPRSSALYRKLAERVSLRTCQDVAFTRFGEILRGWFPPSPESA